VQEKWIILIYNSVSQGYPDLIYNQNQEVNHMETVKLVELTKEELIAENGGVTIIGSFSLFAFQVHDAIESFIAGFDEGYSNTCNCDCANQ
jgi:hypothetical protein